MHRRLLLRVVRSVVLVAVVVAAAMLAAYDLRAWPAIRVFLAEHRPTSL